MSDITQTSVLSVVINLSTLFNQTFLVSTDNIHPTEKFVGQLRKKRRIKKKLREIKKIWWISRPSRLIPAKFKHNTSVIPLSCLD